MNEPVWIMDLACYGYIISEHTYYSVVAYEKDGIIIEEVFDNNDLINRQGYAIDYWDE